LIKPTPFEEKSRGGIIIKADVEDRDNLELAEVIELGHHAYKGLEDETPWVKPGDMILFQRYAGKQVEYLGQVYRIIKDVDVIAIRTE